MYQRRLYIFFGMYIHIYYDKYIYNLYGTLVQIKKLHTVTY